MADAELAADEGGGVASRDAFETARGADAEEGVAVRLRAAAEARLPARDGRTERVELLREVAVEEPRAEDGCLGGRGEEKGVTSSEARLSRPGEKTWPAPRAFDGVRGVDARLGGRGVDMGTAWSREQWSSSSSSTFGAGSSTMSDDTGSAVVGEG